MQTRLQELTNTANITFGIQSNYVVKRSSAIKSVGRWETLHIVSAVFIKPIGLTGA